MSFDWTHKTLGEVFTWGWTVVVAMLAWLGRKIHKMHKLMVSWNGNKITVEKEK